MRKLIAIALGVLTVSGLQAQDYKDVQDPLAKKDLPAAKSAIDKYAGNSKATNKSDYWFYRTKVYSMLGEQGDTSANREALKASQRFYELEKPSSDNLRELIRGQHTQATFGMYERANSKGVNFFQRDRWADAQYQFGFAIDVFNVLAAAKEIESKFDTTRVLFAGYSAQNANDQAAAVYYYGQLADRRLADTTLVGVYEYLAKYYMLNKDEARARNYINTGKELFPGRGNWLAIELSALDGDKPHKLTRMGELMRENPTDMALANDYAVEMYYYIYDKVKPADYEARQQAFTGQLKEMTTRFPNNVLPNYLATRHLAIQIYDLKQEYNTLVNQINTKPDAGNGKPGAKPGTAKPAASASNDAANRTRLNELKAAIDAKYEEMLPFAMTAATLYEAKGAAITSGEKLNYKDTLEDLVDYYKSKKNATEAAKWEAKAKAV